LCFCRDNVPTKSQIFLQKIHHALWGGAIAVPIA
jgi:hypothetical protein